MINFRLGLFLLAPALVALAVASCTRATLIGNDLLDDEIEVVAFTDTLGLQMKVLREDSVLTHSAATGPQIVRHCFGRIDDPFLGTTESIIISQMFLSGIGSEFLEFDVDSVVMTLALDSVVRYGRLDESVDIAITRTGSPLDVNANYYSNDQFSKNFSPMGVRTGIVPNYNDSIVVNRPGDSATLGPHLRIPMNQDFIDNLASQPPATFEFTDSFAAWMPGVHIELTGGENTIVGVDLNDALSAMTIYYSDVDSGFYRSYDFIFTGLFNSNVQVATFDHDYTGSVAEDFIGNTELSDSLIFVQSLSGLNTEFSVQGLDGLGEILVNQAVIEFFVADLGDEDSRLYPPVDRIQTKIMRDSMLVNSRDILLAISVNSLDFFGGDLSVDDQGRLKYSMNITAGIQDIVQGREENRIFISSYLKQNNPRRLVLYGPGHPDFPAKLNLTYTRVQ